MSTTTSSSSMKHRRAPLPAGKRPPLPTRDSTSVIHSPSGPSVISYSYTDMPLRLLAYDVYQFFRLSWALPYVVWPLTPSDSGPMGELAPTLPNLFCLALHAVLMGLQLFFLLGLLPICLLLPVWLSAVLVGLFVAMNRGLCLLLNGPGIEYHSNPDMAPVLPEHAHEQWIFLNGVAAGSHWMQSNLDRLALTFKRPILGIHNKTDGILFDVIECMIQRNFTYATSDVRLCYSIIKETLYRPEITKVVFILHSQGGIEGGLTLDWLLQELPQDLLAKLEVYTFGCAANHFNNPHRNVHAQHWENKSPPVQGQATGDGNGNGNGNGATDREKDDEADPETAMLVRETSSMHPADITQRTIGHIEHYAHTTDFVALWGVLHFASSSRQSPTMPRFLGCVFARASPRGGHQFCQHYLDGMFPLQRDPDTGAIVGCAETNNAFMESDVQIGHDGDEDENVHQAYELSWLAAVMRQVRSREGFSFAKLRAQLEAEVTIHASGPLLVHRTAEEEEEKKETEETEGTETNGRSRTRAPYLVHHRAQRRTVKVKEVSRLWQYRNGKSPHDQLATA